MFCSKCGKTLMPEELKCPHCGNPIGEQRFEGNSYTSVQAHVLPDARDAAENPSAGFARTSYTTMSEAQKEGGAVDSRTTYRPVFEGSAPEDVREDMRAEMESIREDAAAEAAEEAPERPQVTIEDLPQDAIDTLNAVDEELQMDAVDTSDLRTRPIESTGRAGISAGVEEYVQKLEYDRQRRASRRRRAPVYDVPAEESEVDEPAPADENEPVYDADDSAPEVPRMRARRSARRAEPASDAAETAPADAPAEDVYDDVQDVDDTYYDDSNAAYDDADAGEYDDFEEIRYGRGFGVKDVVKVAVIMVLAAALIVAGVLWFRNFRARQPVAPIEGVTDSVYESGIATIKSHTEESYIKSLTDIYLDGNNIADFTAKVAADGAALDELMPEEPAVNDSLFVSTLQAIQTNIGNAVLMDAVEADQGGADNSEASAARWNIVNTSISQLEAASTAQELTAILNGEQVTAATTATPSPTPQATYATLVKDDKSDAVLEMQNRLYVLGFLRDDRDGEFGSKTQTAVKQFQQAAGLPVTGIADNETLTLLYSDDAPRTEYAQVTPKPKS